MPAAAGRLPTAGHTTTKDMQIFTNTNIDFVAKSRIAAMTSLLLIAVSIGSLVVRGLNFGIDFTGGTLVEVGYPRSVELGEVRSHLRQGGFGEAVVQYFGTSRDVLIRLAPRAEANNAQISIEVLRALRASADNKPEVRRVEFVGPQVGDELREDGGLAVLIALGAIFVYVLLRFEWRFSAGAVAALFHDVIITLGFFSVSGMEFDLTVLAAILAVIGYSLNDTIVVFDRIRENFRKIRKGDSSEVINVATNQTLSRTVLTSFTTLLVVVALLIFGGKIIHGFATALCVGILVGTYSSIYVASMMALRLGVSRADLMKIPKEGKVDDRP